MRDAIRCCISCILPCGALDVIRIVHSNGYVEEISGSIWAAEVLKAYPKHVLKKPSSCSMDDDDQGAIPRIIVVPPEAELQRGEIYFLTPVLAATKPTSRSTVDDKLQGKYSSTKKINIKRDDQLQAAIALTKLDTSTANSQLNQKDCMMSRANTMLSDSDQYLSEILKEKVSTQRERPRGRVRVWRPHLESITEAIGD
ncbi:hypothetical protein Dimus_032655 [Dionaea muscipula]